MTIQNYAKQHIEYKTYYMFLIYLNQIVFSSQSLLAKFGEKTTSGMCVLHDYSPLPSAHLSVSPCTQGSHSSHSLINVVFYQDIRIYKAQEK